jgi:hypothetical protein
MSVNDHGYIAMVLHVIHLSLDHGYSAQAVSRNLGIELSEVKDIIAKEKEARRG